MFQKINQGNSFKGLSTGYLLSREIRHNTSKQFAQEVKSIRQIIRKNNLHKKDNVDIILQYSKEDGFYGVISSKQQGTPNNPSYKCPIDSTKSQIDKFIQWAEAWDEAYSPKLLDRFSELMEWIKNGCKKEA